MEVTSCIATLVKRTSRCTMQLKGRRHSYSGSLWETCTCRSPCPSCLVEYTAERAGRLACSPQKCSLCSPYLSCIACGCVCQSFIGSQQSPCISTRRWSSHYVAVPVAYFSLSVNLTQVNLLLALLLEWAPLDVVNNRS
eukprot:scaffold173475_cov23-Tisochrysis_lutea.AAC.1